MALDLGVSGLASGFDWRSFIDQMVDVQRAPQRSLLTEQNTIQRKKSAYSALQSQLAVLQTRIESLKKPEIFDARSSQSSDEKIATINASDGAALGNYNFNFTQLATAAKLNGSFNIGGSISATDDVSGVQLDSAAFSKSITAGTFSVNGAQITVASTDSLQDVFNSINAVTGGNVTGSYDSATDTVSLGSASGELILGSATDTSNILSVLRLYNNGTGSTTSNGSLGGINQSATLAAANFSVPVDDGGAGVFKINGVEISYSATADGLSNVLKRINESSAGVNASYDSINDRIVLTNKGTGDQGISIEDVTGNFAAATGLGAGTLERGKNLLYSINGGGTLVSTSNVITEDSSGIAGMSITARAQGSVDVNVSTDSSKIKTAIKDFLTEYNKTQSIIDTNSASTTDAKGKVTAGILADESDVGALGSKLRSTAFAIIGGFASSMNQLSDIGITTNGNDNSLTLDNETALDNALAQNLQGVKKLFTDPTDGIATKLNAYLEATIGDDGTLATKDNKLTKEIASIDTQISDMEKLVASSKLALIDSFVRMETAQSQSNSQLQFLKQRFGS